MRQRSRELWIWLRPSPTWGYTMRVLLAFAGAIYAAYWLELDSPYSAGTTVLVLMNTSRGAVISKSLWRLVGSSVGIAAAIALVAAFAQTPVLFIVGLALWVGLCSAVASLLRYHRGYGVVLAGYTVTLVAFGAIAEPEHIFDLATARLAVVSIGVLATAMVFLITDHGPGREQLRDRVTRLVSRAAGVLRDALVSGDLSVATQARTQVAQDLTGLDQLVEFATVEDGGSGRFAGDLRFAVAQLFATLPGGLHAVTLVRQLQGPERAALGELTEALGQLADAQPGQTETDLRRSIDGLRVRLAERTTACRDTASLAALDQAVALLGQFAGALDSLHALWEGVPSIPAIRLRNYVNLVTAARNGVRAAIAIVMAGLFWIVTGWSDGSSMLVLLGVVCALASQSDSAAQASLDFLKGTALAVLAAFVCVFGILPQMAGFPLLMAGILPFIAAGVFFGRQPRFAVVSLGFLVFFIILVAPQNPMRYDLAHFLNVSCALLVGSTWAVLAFRALLPPNPKAEAVGLAHSMRDAVQRLVRSRRLPHLIQWEHLQLQRMVRLSLRLASNPDERRRAIGSGAAAIVIGRHLLTLRHAIGDKTLDGAAHRAILRTLASFRRLCAAPLEASAAARNEALFIESTAASPKALHLAAALRDLGALVREQAEFFASDPIPFDPRTRSRAA